MKRLAVWLSVLVLGLVGRAPAAEAQFHPELDEATGQLARARGPETYTALREVWGTWDRAEPLHVEEALRAASRDRRATPPVRAYATLLTAFARIRRGDTHTATRQIAELGFVDDWLVVGPFDNEGKSGLDRAFEPELGFDGAVVPGRAYSGKERAVRWRVAPDVFHFGWLDGGALLRPESKVCMYATTFVRGQQGTRTPRPITVWVGTSGAFKLFWNGVETLKDEAYRGWDADRRAALVTLKPGSNNLTVKVCGDDSPPLVSVRLADRTGAPDTGIVTTATIAESAEAAKNHEKKAARVAGRDPEGPLEAFERITSAKNVRPADKEAYARYLAVTGGDDPVAHVARDMARAAAEADPDVDRLLLAGQLSEDRNKYSDRVDEAERYARAHGQWPHTDVLLARAAVLESGPAWRKAFPVYDRLLAADPDNATAVRGRVELYNRAGLRRTALTTLERAVARNPHAVTLLNMYATQLRVLGRTTEAEEAEARYSSLRFDDPGFIGRKLDLALARRDRAGAERWVRRLLQIDPDSQWAHGVAAAAYRRTGQAQRAVATYERALEIAPEDVSTMRALADLHGELGNTDKQLALLRGILELRPQDKDTRLYVEHIEPAKPRADEKYAWKADRFLKLRHAAPGGEAKRTLVDLSVTTVYENGLSSSFRQVVFQPLTDSAAAVARQYAFQYQADRQTVELRGAKVYRGDGRVLEAIESGEAAANNPAIAMYTSARTFYVQLPRLEPGDVVELRYRVDDVTPRNEFADYFGEVTYMQSGEPVRHAEYVLITPKSRKLEIDARRVPNLKKKVVTKGKQRIYRFTADDVPAVDPEPAMPPWPEVLGYVHVSTYRDWKAMGKWYWGLAKDQFDLDDETRKLLREITKGAKSDREKVEAVYGWVVENTRYVALEFGIYGYKPRRCVQTVARGWGDCKDKATVIVSMLRELGIDATIVIVRTQNRGGFDSKVASLAPFDHAIAYVPSLDLYLDGTAEHTGTDELPIMDQGAVALLVNEGDSKLVKLPYADPKKTRRESTVSAKLAADGSAALSIEFETIGSYAPQWRHRYRADGTRRERLSEHVGRSFPSFEILPGAAGVKTSDLDDIEKPVKIAVQGKAPSFARREGDQLSMDVTLATRLTPVYASLSRRTRDVKLPPIGTLRDRYSVTLPPGAKVVSAPIAVKKETRFGSYEVKVEQQAGKVTVESRLTVTVHRVTPKDYAAWRTFCGDVDRALSPRLVVSR